MGADLRASRYFRFGQWLSILYNHVIVDVNNISITLSVNVLIVGFDVGVTDILPCFFFAFAGPFIDRRSYWTKREGIPV